MDYQLRIIIEHILVLNAAVCVTFLAEVFNTLETVAARQLIICIPSSPASVKAPNIGAYV